MKIIEVKRLESGMVTAEDIVTKHGQVIAPRQTVITDSLIARLRFYGINQINVEGEPAVSELSSAPAPTTSNIPEPPPPVIDTSSYIQKMRETPEYQKFQTDYANTIVYLKEAFDVIINGDTSSLQLDALVEEATSLFQSKTTIQLFDLIHGMKGSDDSVYVHSINVALIARCIAKWLRMSKRQMDEVLLAGLLHDIGKTQIPEEVLNKDGKLTDDEFDMIRRHPTEGIRLLKRVPGLDAHIVNAASQHHERYDGSGYPRRMQTDEIDDFASILAIADVYDAMTAVRVYREPRCAFQVIEAFEDEGLQKYKPQFILTFLERVAATYQNSRVILNDGLTARIIYINPGRLSRPVVRLDDGNIIDLSRTPGKHITAIV